jgi:4-hydroxy 2-oxovalerate aldolase
MTAAQSVLVEVLDTTLREGSYVVDFQLEEKFVVDLLNRMDETPIKKIEIGHGVGFEAERAGIRPCNIELKRWCEIARAELASSEWGMFAQPEFSRLTTLRELCDQGMSFVRIGMTAEQVPQNLDYIKRATEMCPQVYLNLMKSSATPAERIPALLDGIPDNIAGLYVVDSYGSMLPSDIQRYVEAAKQCCPVVGFHGHDNLGMANANSLAALECGAAIIDGTLAGIGRGAGNAETESLAGILSMVGEDVYSYQQLASLAEFSRNGLDARPDNRNLQVLGGVIGVHSGFFPLIEQVCAELYIDPGYLMSTAVELAEHSVGKKDILAAAQLIAERTAMTGSSPMADAPLGGEK